MQDLQPARLRADFEKWRARPAQMRRVAPSRVFAAIGQALADGVITPEEESKLIAKLLTYWAMRDRLNTSAICAQRTRSRATALVT
jgi:hypothetical protein